jgi:hypothetical protein
MVLDVAYMVCQCAFLYTYTYTVCNVCFCVFQCCDSASLFWFCVCCNRANLRMYAISMMVQNCVFCASAAQMLRLVSVRTFATIVL